MVPYFIIFLPNSNNFFANGLVSSEDNIDESHHIQIIMIHQRMMIKTDPVSANVSED
jgi:hypothetical protein